MHSVVQLPILLKELRLPSMVRVWESFLEKAKGEGWSHERFLAALCEQEVEERNQRRIQSYLKRANLPLGKSLSTFDFDQVKNLDRAKVENLAYDPSWVTRSENLLVFGASGVGKTHLCAAIGYALVEKGIRVLFTSTTKLVQNLQAARRQCQLPAALDKLDLYNVIILDDIGYVRKDEAETHVLFELIAQRYESGSLIVTCNQPFSEWDSIFTTNAMTVAAIDRLVHHATILEITSESFRKKHAIKQG
jgi:DNA replication protein DnaC